MAQTAKGTKYSRRKVAAPAVPLLWARGCGGTCPRHAPGSQANLKNSLFSPLDQPLNADALGHNCATEMICRAINPAE